MTKSVKLYAAVPVIEFVPKPLRVCPVMLGSTISSILVKDNRVPGSPKLLKVPWSQTKINGWSINGVDGVSTLVTGWRFFIVVVI